MGVLMLRHAACRACRLGVLWLSCGVAVAAGPRPDLASVYVDAIDNNAAYRSAVLQYNAALEARPAARSQLLPQLGIEADYSWIKQEVDGTFYTVDDLSRSDSFKRLAYGAAFSQTLFQLDQFLELKKSDQQIAQARVALADAKDELQIGVASAYFSLLGAEESLLSVRAEKDAVAGQLEQARGRYDSGLIPDADVKAAQARYDLVLADEISAINAVELARTQLTLIAGGSYGEVQNLPQDIPLPLFQDDDLQLWIDRALSYNLPLLLQQLATRVAEIEEGQARAKRLPIVSLVGSYAFFDQNGGISGARDDLDERIGVNVKLPLFSGGLISSGIRYAHQLQLSEQAMLQQTEAQALQDTRAAFLNAKSALARSRALEQAVRSAVAAEESAQVGFEVGTRTQAELMTATRERYSAQRDLTLARYAYLLARLQLKRASGQLTVSDLDEISSLLR